jgi:hypothetical protein
MQNICQPMEVARGTGHCEEDEEIPPTPFSGKVSMSVPYKILWIVKYLLLVQVHFANFIGWDW